MHSTGLWLKHTRQVLLITAFSTVTTAASVPRFTIDGHPITGSFAVRWEPDELRHALDTDVNLFFCYERRARNKLLDLRSEMGALIHERKAKVMANICFLVCSGPLAKDLDATATEIEVARPLKFAEPRVLWVGEEAVLVQRGEGAKLVGCQRGHKGTSATAHPKGEYLMHDALARREIKRVKGSPNLWGYWVIDDKRGNQRGALRALYRLIKELDVDSRGRPYNHVVVAGMANEDALANFDQGVCDMAGVYIYPAHRGVYRPDLAAQRLSNMLPVMRERSPETAFMGIFQAFTGPKWSPKPTRLQVRKQVTDFAHFGASALMVYSWRMVGDTKTLRNMPDLREEYGQIIRDVRSGDIQLDQPRPNYPARQFGEADLSALAPLLTFDTIAPDLEPNPRMTAGYAPGPNGKRWLHLNFKEYVLGKAQWPGVRIGRAHMVEDADYAGAGWVVAKVHNYLALDSEVGLSFRDSRGEPWWARYYPLPPGQTTSVCVPLAAVRRVIAFSDLMGMTALMRRPPEPTHMALEGLYLAPPSFSLTEAELTAAIAEAGPTIDGDASDPGWAAAQPAALRDEILDLPPSRPCAARVVCHGSRIALLFRSQLRGRPLIVSEGEETTLWRCLDDTVEVTVIAASGPAHVRFVTNSAGSHVATAYDAKGQPTEPPAIEHASRVQADEWVVEIAIDVASLGRKGPWRLGLRRHDVQVQHLTWPKSPATPIGIEPVGKLSMDSR